MSPSNSKLLRNCESTLCIQNNNGKRSFFKTLENDVTEYSIYNKRKKPIKHSEADINNAVLAAPGGYMTRNRLSKQLTQNSELEEASITEDKCSKTDNLQNKSESAKKNKKSTTKISQNKLQLGYVFTHDISLSYPGKQLTTENKKSTPSLFESDSDPEIEDFQINYSTKNEVKNISTCISNSDIICSAFDKNVEMKTYFNKKSYTFNNKSNIKSLNTFEKSNQESSTLSNNVKLNHDSNLCKSISPNSSETSKLLSVTDSKTSECVQQITEDDSYIIVTDSFIRQLDNEFQMVKTKSQGVLRTQEKFDGSNTNKCNASDIEQHKDNEVVSEVLSLIDEVNTNNICTNIDDICGINTINFNSSMCTDLLLKQDINVMNKLEKSKLSPFKTTNTVDGLLSIFDVPKDNKLVKNYVNINDSVIGYSDSNTSTSISDNMIELNNLQTYEFDYNNSDQSIENHLISEKKITCPLLPDQTEPNLVINQYFHTTIKDEIKFTSDCFNSRNNHDSSLKNNISSFSKDDYSKKKKNLYSNCYCKNFSSFNNNDNTILSSKINHFAFNNNAKKVRQKVLHQKHLEANILKILITKERNYIIQSKKHIPIFNSTPTSIKYEKCIQSVENDHIKPNILTMLKDVYVDVEYLTEYSDHNTSDISFHKSPKSEKKNKDNKINFQVSEVKPIQNMCMSKDNNDSTSNNETNNKPINLKPCKENDVNLNINKIIDKPFTSNYVTKKKPVNFKPCNGSYFNFNKNKIVDDGSMYNNTPKNKPINFNLKPHDGNDVNFDKNEIIDNTSMLNNTIKNKSTYLKPCNKNYVNFNISKIIVNDSTSNSPTTKKPVNMKLYDENYVNFNKMDIICSSLTSNCTTKKKSINLKPCDEKDFNLNINKIIDNTSMSNNTAKKKSIDFKPCDEKDFNLNINKLIDNTSMSNNTAKKKSIDFKPCDEKDFNLNINKLIDNTSMSNNTAKKKSIDFKPCDENYTLIDYETNNFIKKNDFDCGTVYKSHVVNANFDTISKIKVEDCLNYDITDTNYNLKTEKRTGFEIKPFDIRQPNDSTFIINKNNNSNKESKMSKVKISNIESENILSFTLTSKDKNKTVPAVIESEKKTNMLKIFEPPQYKNLVYTCSNEDQICSILPDISEPPVKNVLNLPIDDISFSFNNSSSDDDCDDDNRLLIEDAEVNILKDVKVSNPNLPIKKISISDDFHETLSVLKEENNSLDGCMSIQMCNEFYKTITLNKSIDKKNESLPKNIQDILREMYVDELFVTTCQHMIELNNDGQLKNNEFLSTDGCKNVTSEKFVCDIINENVEKKTYSEFNQSIPTNVETLSRPEINHINQKTNKPSNFITDVKNSLSQHKTNVVKNIYPELIPSISTKKETILNTEINNCNQEKKLSYPTTKTQNSNSLQKPKNIKSNIKIRMHLREFIKSNIPLNEIFESKEFRNFKFFGEEEIASSISVFIFEQTIEPPIITGLSVFRENYDQLKIEEKNRILTSTNLNISCPKIMKLTSISLALVKMLRSDTLIEIILNVIRKNVLKKQMNIDHTIDSQLIKQILYFVDICVRLRLLKTLQIFIFDSMVFLPNKYCCIIFISLLLWKNCLPRSINNEEDPVIIVVMSYLIAKKKLYSEETVGCDIFQRELINLLSCHFNYTFSIDMPTNFIQHIHKPDFFVSVVMFLKCCNPKDLAEFMVNCLFPIIDNYLNTQQNEMYAIKTMESIIMAVKPFKIACNSTVATYLKKCKDPTNSGKTNGKEHIYNSIYNSYKILQSKFIEYLNDSRPRSQYFEESLMSMILMLGSVDYLDSCMSLMQWKPKFELSSILSKKIFLFKSIIGHIVWDKLCAIDDIKTLKCLVNSCVLNKDVHNTIIRIHALR